MNTFLIYLLIGLVSSVTLNSCKSKKDKDVQPITKSSLLTGHKWEFNRAILTSQPEPMTWKFIADGTYTRESPPDIHHGTWELSDNDTKLTLDGKVVWTIILLNNTYLNLESTTANGTTRYYLIAD